MRVPPKVYLVFQFLVSYLDVSRSVRVRREGGHMCLVHMYTPGHRLSIKTTWWSKLTFSVVTGARSGERGDSTQIRCKVVRTGGSEFDRWRQKTDGNRAQEKISAVD